MKIAFEGQVPKELSCPGDNEDVYSIDLDRSLIVLCDGASESYDSKTWAAILATNFTGDQTIESTWIDDLISSYESQFDFQEMSWFKRAAFERGSFSTFLSARYSADNDLVEIIGIGDSVALFLHGSEMVDSFPYTSAEEFKKRPTLLSTRSEHNRFLSSSDEMSLRRKTWSIDPNQSPCLLLMTDALAEWLLRTGQAEKLLSINDVTEFEELILSERTAKNMRTDDSTLLKILF